MKKILVSVDFSKTSLNALQYAVGIAKTQEAEIHVLTVYNSIKYSPVMILGDINQSLVDESYKLNTKLHDIAKKACNAANVPFKTHVIVGAPEVEIQKLARRIKATLIVMGQTGNGGLKRFFMGSTTSHVINTSKIPVMVVPGNKKYKPLSKIVFATDLTPTNLSTIKPVVDFAREFEATVVLLYITLDSSEENKTNVQKLEKLLRKKFKYEHFKSVVSDHILPDKGIYPYLKKHHIDLAALVKQHVIDTSQTRINTGKMADSFDIPVIVFD